MHTHAVIPFSVLEAVRAADVESIAAEYGDPEELSTIRLGRSPTITAQIAKYRSLARRGARVDPHEVGGIIKLIGRRRDADLVMAEAGRRAGEYAAEWFVARPWRMLLRMTPGALKKRLGTSIVRRTALAVFEVNLDEDETASWHDTGSLTVAAGDAKPCDVLRAATAELLRQLTSFDGALFHIACRKQGDDGCVWSTNPTD